MCSLGCSVKQVHLYTSPKSSEGMFRVKIGKVSPPKGYLLGSYETLVRISEVAHTPPPHVVWKVEFPITLMDSQWDPGMLF